MHDAIHGSYSGNGLVNKLISFSAVIIGADPQIWKIQHNVLHHTYTNIEHADEDISPRYVMRFSPNQPKRWFHRFQHIYALFFYSISTLIWVTYKDFLKMFDYYRQGLVKKSVPFGIQVIFLLFRKSLYYFFLIALPIIVLPFSTWIVLMMFVSMHLVSGLLLSLVFQTAHVMPNSHFIMPESDEDLIENNWSVHQLLTTTNYAMKNKLIYWFTGGLNHQIEHHLFPHVCHVHYPQLAKIVRNTTDEFNLPYYAERSFGSAIASHFRMLKLLGRHTALHT